MRKLKQQDLLDAEIPKKYWDASLFSIELHDKNYSSIEKVYKYINNLKHCFDNGIGLYINSGYIDFTGKTFLAVFMCKLFLAHSRDCLYKKFNDISQLYYKEYGKYKKVIDKSFLVIDNISNLSNKELDILDKILMYRYENTKSTIIVFNNMLLTSLTVKTQNIIEELYYNIDLTYNTKRYSKKV